MSFFSQYLLLHPLTFTQLCKVHVYCDNCSVIEWIQSTSSCPYLRDAIHNDYPIFAEIQGLLCTMPNMHIQYHHVKGHQKETADHFLTLPKWLTINCDTQATKLPPTPLGLPLNNNPISDAGYPHLIINNQCIIQHLQQHLCNAASHTYFDYLTNKFSWNHPPEQAIQWPLSCTTLNCFKATGQWTITKFIYEWLPLQYQYQVRSNSTDKLCPSCHQMAKIVEHFLACPHPGCQQIWKELRESLHKHQIHNLITNIFYVMFAIGLYHVISLLDTALASLC